MVALMPGGDLALAPGIEGVVDEPATFQQPVAIGLDIQPAQPDRQQPGPGGVGVQVVGDVSGVHDLGQRHQRRVAVEVVVVDEDLEGALAVAVGVAGVGSVEADGTLALRCVEDLAGGT